MSDNKKENKIQNIESFDDDDLWEIQAPKTENVDLSLKSKSLENIDENDDLELNFDDEKVDTIDAVLDLDNVDESNIENNNDLSLDIEVDSLIKNDDDENNSLINSLELEEKIEEIIEDKPSIVTEEVDILDRKKQELIYQQEMMISNVNLFIQEGLKELEEKKQNLELSIQKLEQRKERIEQEMRTTFSGVSQDLAIRVQGFKDYLVGSLQDLTFAAEQLELSNNSSQSWETVSHDTPRLQNNNPSPQFVEKNFKEETRQIRGLLDQYRTKPDYYGSPWQLRRTFEPIHAQRVTEWFFSQGGRGALRSMGTRLQNILVASAIMSILYQLYGARSRTLILADTPERLGEWRRGLQDCLGISRSDFGPTRGVVLFETPESLIQKGDRIVEEKDLPLVIIDQSDDKVSLSLLKFPLWLAFAPETTSESSNYYY